MGANRSAEHRLDAMRYKGTTVAFKTTGRRGLSLMLHVIELFPHHDLLLAVFLEEGEQEQESLVARAHDVSLSMTTTGTRQERFGRLRRLGLSSVPRLGLWAKYGSHSVRLYTKSIVAQVTQTWTTTTACPSVHCTARSSALEVSSDCPIIRAISPKSQHSGPGTRHSLFAGWSAVASR